MLLVPGLGDSGPDHWQSHWQLQLEGARRVIQATGVAEARTVDAGSRARAIDFATQPPIVIAHSFGCLAAVRAAHLGAGSRTAARRTGRSGRYDVDED